jgi:hypothetical protein
MVILLIIKYILTALMMNIEKINLEGIEMPVHDFLDKQRSFLTDASIIC